MSNNKLSVRELQKIDIPAIIDYWYNAKPSFLTGLGVDLNKLPEKDNFRKMLAEQLEQTYKEKKSYCIIWLIDGIPSGHSNINKIIFGEEAFMHLHLWKSPIRQKGIGTILIRMTIPLFFNNFKLKKLYCEPFSLNAAPNKTLEKAGFIFVKKHITTPGWLNFEQEVNLWEMSVARFTDLHQSNYNIV